MSEINLNLKSYDELIFEITRLNTDNYLLQQNQKNTINFLKHLRKTFDKNDEMYELLGEAIYLLKGESDD